MAKQSHPQPRSSPFDAALLAADGERDVLVAIAAATWAAAERSSDPDVPAVTALAAWLVDDDDPPSAEVLQDAHDRLATVVGAGAEWVAVNSVRVTTINGDRIELYRPSGTGNLQLVAHSGDKVVMSVAEVHRTWVALYHQTASEPRPRHPLAPLVAGWQERPPEVAANLRPDPILPAIRVSQTPERDYGQLLGGIVPDEPSPALPLFPDSGPPVRVRVPLLELADAAGVVSMARGRGAPLDLRLVVEALLSVPPERRTAETRIVVSVAELLAGLAGDRPRGGKLDAWRRIRAALLAAGSRWIPWRAGGRWWPVRLRAEPGDRPALNDPVVLLVACPPGSASGPVIDREALRAAGRHSGPRYRTLIGVPTVAWIPGVTRFKVRGPGGLWIGDRHRYVVLTEADRRRIVFGPAVPGERRLGRDADCIIRETPELVVLDEHARDPKTGRPGWLVVPTGAARAINAAERRNATTGNLSATTGNLSATTGNSDPRSDQ